MANNRKNTRKLHSLTGIIIWWIMAVTVALFFETFSLLTIAWNLVILAIIINLDWTFSKMPIAVVANTTKRYELTTLPEAYVVVRRMTYGEKLIRSGLATKFIVGGSTTEKNFSGQLDIQQEEVAYWDFDHLIVEHNLQDLDERLLNFKNKGDVKKLDGAVGDEVGRYIDEWNDVESTQEAKNS